MRLTLKIGSSNERRRGALTPHRVEIRSIDEGVLAIMQASLLVDNYTLFFFVIQDMVYLFLTTC